MGQKYNLALEQNQKLIITTELRQALALLQLPALELADYLEEQVLENPLLETEPGNGEEELSRNDVSIIDRSIDWQGYLENQGSEESGPGSSLQTSLDEAKRDPFVTPFTPSLQDYLLEQLHVTDCGKNISRMAEYIIGNLDERGYLVFDLDELAQEQQCPLREMEAALSLVQSFEPAGIAARDLKECLSLQLRRKSSAYFRILELIDYLEELAAGRLPKVAQALRLPLSQIQTMADIIRTLDPKPGERFLAAGEARFIVPDIVVVEEEPDQFVILANDDPIPRLHINQLYRKVLLQENGDVRKFVEQKLNAAAWLIKSVEQRRLTLNKVAEAVMRRQEDFLHYGVSCLKPLTMREIADEIGMHESTVSRAAANKYVQTPQGIYEFKYFFANRLGEEQMISTEGIKQLLHRVLAAENPFCPESDQKLTERLKANGIEISRRTVAKYREEMGIPAASARKRYELQSEK